jgi:tetratricopeptide (TPR) repeat protein
MLLARIGMLRTSIIYSKHDVDKFIEDSLRLAQTINDPNLIAQLNYTLAVAYAHRAETQKALGHAQLALGYWHKNRTMKNRVLLIMAEACRSIGLFERAAWYMQHVETIYDRSYEDALQAYARGALLVELEHPQEALQWLDVAQNQFAALDRRYMTGATCQTIALAQIQLEQFDDAHQNIRRALIIWEQIENQYQKAEAVYTLGYLHHARNELDKARSMYDFALGIAQNMTLSPMVSGLIARLQDDLDQLNHASQ